MTRRTSALLTAAALAATALLTCPAGPSAAAGSGTYVNPVSKAVADTFADPSVIRGKDGYWYAYGTSDPLHEGERVPHRIPIVRSRDLVRWTHVGDAFTESTMPSWAAEGAGLWAPDIRYVDGGYRLYYVVTDTTTDPGSRDDNAIGMATAPSPTGPWTDSGAPVVGPRTRDNGSYLWTFDPAVVSDRDGSQWIVYGSYNGGVFVQPLDAAGQRTTGQATMVAIDNKFEGAYVVQHGGYWYLFASTANCCAGPTTGYSVQVGRSRDLRGPYLDAQGTPLVASRAGGTPVLTQNGNRWVGAGHNAIARDVTGQDWIVYHAINRADPYLDGMSGINQRPMLLDRLDWLHGWPVVRAGRGPSDTRRPAPVTSTQRRLRDTGDAGVVTRRPERGPVLVEADLAGRSELFVRSPERGRGHAVRALLRPAHHQLWLVARSGGVRVARTAPLPAGLDLGTPHSVNLRVQGSTAYAELSQARLGDPLGRVHVRLPTRMRSGARVAGAVGAAANVTVARPARAPHPVHEQVPARLDRAGSDEFDGSLGPGWHWIRRDGAAQVAAGALRWPTQAADLVGADNTAAVLLRDAPTARRWSIETKLTIDLGTDTVRNYQQAGLVVYANDDLFTRLCHVAIWNTRQTEFGKEMPYAGRLSYGGTIVGPPADTTYLRITHRLDPATGEHELRGWSSRDGQDWVQGGVWTLPAHADLQVGLVSHGGGTTDPPATATFDWFRTYR